MKRKTLTAIVAIALSLACSTTRNAQSTDLLSGAAEAATLPSKAVEAWMGSWVPDGAGSPGTYVVRFEGFTPRWAVTAFDTLGAFSFIDPRIPATDQEQRIWPFFSAIEHSPNLPTCIPIPEDGVYSIAAVVEWGSTEGNAKDGQRELAVNLQSGGGTSVLEQSILRGVSLSRAVDMAAGDPVRQRIDITESLSVGDCVGMFLRHTKRGGAGVPGRLVVVATLLVVMH